MSRPPERENETPQAPPNVYHPRPTAPPAYEEYTDPAAAHGWRNEYDETAQLPRVSDETAADHGQGESSGAGA
ncbi:hypothetical protein PBV88_53005, partial [Streptomyces sp. T21Q-yed]|nr:hypothetical protein [Streptomyces sp. T21Q-yed]